MELRRPELLCSPGYWLHQRGRAEQTLFLRLELSTKQNPQDKTPPATASVYLLISTKAMAAKIKYINSGLILGFILASTEHNERREI
jgi:hypothetical protein